MNHPPQGGYGNPPANQGGYQSPPPQGQYGYPPPPGQYPPQHPQQFQQRPIKTGPSKGLGILKVLVGFGMTAGFGVGLLVAGYDGLGAGAILGAFLGLGLRFMVTGGANVVGKKIPLLPSFGIVLVGLLVGTFAGPPVSEGYWQSREQSTWNELSSYSGPEDYVNHWEWDHEYFDMIPREYQREEAPGMRKYIEVRESIQDNNLVELRQHVYDLAINYKDDPHYKLAFDTASGELQKRYNAVLEKLGKPGQAGEDAEFAADEDLRAAFKTILTDLAKAPTPDVYVAFTNTAQLEKPPGSEEDVKDWFATEPSVKTSFPDGNVLVIDPGKAFSSEYDAARRQSFMEVAGEAFRQSFDANLLTLKPLESGESRDGKYVLEVSSTIVRVPSHFNNYETDANGRQTSKGLLFGIVVDWGLKLYDRKGGQLYDKETRSAPASNINIGAGAMPDWGVYSILMDSAYFNYSREVIGSFGLEPPTIKETFSYRDYGVSGG
ncbi:MAG: hypothetical protein K8I27_08715 [Planctomycetes bacterium]|nr:hypothetical protein [Planctomycetota bacterium]